ncbi:hypothetical protein CL634_01980 [bacterium]|nr:hypothetical protein [bacterium]
MSSFLQKVLDHLSAHVGLTLIVALLSGFGALCLISFFDGAKRHSSSSTKLIKCLVILGFVVFWEIVIHIMLSGAKWIWVLPAMIVMTIMIVLLAVCIQKRSRCHRVLRNPMRHPRRWWCDWHS